MNILDFKKMKRDENALVEHNAPSTSKTAQQSPQKRANKRKLTQVTNCSVTLKSYTTSYCNPIYLLTFQPESPKSKKAGPTRRSTDLNRSIKSPASKKAKRESDASPSKNLRRLTGRPEPSSPAKSPSKASKSSPTKTESPPKTSRNKELTDEEQEKRRLLGLERLKESIRYDGEFQCIAAQESIFSRLNEEYLDEEEELNEPKLEHFVPFASVGNTKRTEPTE